MLKRCNAMLLADEVVILCGCKTVPILTKDNFSHFVGLEKFSNFTRSQNENGEAILLSPKIKSPIPMERTHCLLGMRLRRLELF